MKQHKWYPSETNFLSVCKSCGIVLVGPNKETQCPPWIEAKQSDTSDSSALESVLYYVRDAKEFLSYLDYSAAFSCLIDADRLLTELIEEDSK